MSTRLFGTDGVRGLANRDAVTPFSVVRLGMAAADVLGQTGGTERPFALIGRDSRASGELLEHAMAAGLAGAGLDVRLAGVVPTPAVAHLARSAGAAFGVVISASHNPYEDNGVKFFSANGGKLSDAEELAIETRYRDCSLGTSLPTGIGVGRTRALADAVERYAEFAASTVPRLKGAPLPLVVVDCAQGAAFETTPRALQLVGIRFEAHHITPDGYNINAACGSMHPECLAGLTRRHPGAIGLAHDGDADRVLFCDEAGELLDGDEVLALVATHLLTKGQLRENTVVATVMSNYGLEAALAVKGGAVLRTGVGDRLVLDAMRQLDLNLGGEQSGHFIFRDHAPTGDGLIAALQVLAIMAETGQTLRELRTVLKKFPQVLRNVAVRERVPLAEVPVVQAAVTDAERRLAGRGRVLLRYSGTERKVRLLLEGPDLGELTEAADELERVVREELGG
ncbi:MAG TPA: phosphoglucosamine mutase [Chthoniobacterales bacterium]